KAQRLGRGRATVGDVVLERIGRVVRRTDDDHARALEQAARAVAGSREELVRRVEDFARARGVEVATLAEGALELEVRPMKERVPEGFRHRSSPGLEFLEVARVARAVALGDAVRAHGAPFVVVAVEPELGEGAEAMVAPDLARR